jgi:hypothetical protein
MIGCIQNGKFLHRVENSGTKGRFVALHVADCEINGPQRRKVGETLTIMAQ